MTSSSPLPPRRPTARILFAEVIGTQTPTPLLRRVWLRCPELGSGRPVIPGAWVRIYVPDLDDGGRLAAGSQEVAGRTPRSYTVTRWNADRGTFALDFVLHGRGPAASWAAGVSPGEELPLAGPLGRFVFRDDIRLVVLAGDTTALPAIRELSVAVPSAADVRILIEAPPTERLSWDAPTATASAPGPRNTSAPGSGGTGAPGPGGMVQVEWIDQGGLVRLGPGIIPPGWNPRDPALTLWLAAEAHTVSQIRRDLLGAGVPPQALHAAGYWRATPRPLA